MAFNIDPNIPLQAKTTFDPASIIMQAQQNAAALERHRFEMQKLREEYDTAKELRSQQKRMQQGIANDLQTIRSGSPAQYAPLQYQQTPQTGQMPFGMTGVLASEAGKNTPQPQVFGQDLLSGNYNVSQPIVKPAVAGAEPSYADQLQIAVKNALAVGDVDSAFKYSQALQQQRVAEREQNAPVGNPYPVYDAQGNFVGTRIMTKAGQELPFGAAGTTTVKPDVLTAKDKVQMAFDREKLDRQLEMEQKKIDAEAKKKDHPVYFNTNLTGEEFLKTLSKSDQAHVKAISEGREPFPTAKVLSSSPYYERIADAVVQYNPDFDATAYKTRQRAASDFTTGIQGRQMLAFGSAVKHLETLGSLVDAMSNGDTVSVNRIGNVVSKQFGGVPVNNFEAAKGIVAKEIMKSIVTGGGGVEERQELSRLMDSAKSPQQLKGVIDTYHELMNAQYENLLIQRDAAGLPRSTLPDYTKESASKPLNHGDIVNDLPATAPKGAVAKNPETGKPEYIFNGVKWIPFGRAK